jgi:HEAT repeat protein
MAHADPRLPGALTRLLATEPRTWTRAYVARMLAFVAGNQAEAVQALRAAVMEDEDFEVRASARCALSHIDRS